MKTDDPICGNCGKKRSQHYREDQLYCNTRTNGDVFTDTPNDYHLVGYLMNRMPTVHEKVVLFWRQENGHE